MDSKNAPRSRAGVRPPPASVVCRKSRGMSHLEVLVEADALAPVLVQRLEHVHRRGAERALAERFSQLGRIDLSAAVGVRLVEHGFEGEDLLLVVLFGYLGQRAGHLGGDAGETRYLGAGGVCLGADTESGVELRLQVYNGFSGLMGVTGYMYVLSSFSLVFQVCTE